MWLVWWFHHQQQSEWQPQYSPLFSRSGFWTRTEEVEEEGESSELPNVLDSEEEESKKLEEECDESTFTGVTGSDLQARVSSKV